MPTPRSSQLGRSSSDRYRKPALWYAALASLAVFACFAAPGAIATPATTDATSLQEDVDALVAAGAPGAILLVRDGTKTTRLTAGFEYVGPALPRRLARLLLAS